MSKNRKYYPFVFLAVLGIVFLALSFFSATTASAAKCGSSGYDSCGDSCCNSGYSCESMPGPLGGTYDSCEVSNPELAGVGCGGDPNKTTCSDGTCVSDPADCGAGLGCPQVVSCWCGNVNLGNICVSNSPPGSITCEYSACVLPECNVACSTDADCAGQQGGGTCNDAGTCYSNCSGGGGGGTTYYSCTGTMGDCAEDPFGFYTDAYCLNACSVYGSGGGGYCGDNSCNNGETCSTCPQDCGSCTYYSCSGSNCVENPSGGYTSSDCNNECGGTPTPTPTPTPTATCISWDPPSSAVAGQPFTLSVTMRNDTGQVWQSATQYKLGSYDSSSPPWTTIWYPGRWALPVASVNPGDTVTFSNISITAPSTPGTYTNFGFRMLQEGIVWLDATCGPATVNVITPTPTPTPSAPTADIKAGGSDGPISITNNTAITISWTSTNAVSCDVTKNGSAFSSGISNSGVSSGNLTSTTFAISCTGPGGTATNNVEVRILGVSLSASPNSGTAPLNNVSLTATVSGTSSGTYRYFFDCTNDGTNELDTSDISSNPYTASSLCNYSSASTYTAKVTAWHNKGTAVGTATVTVAVSTTPTVPSVTVTEPDYCISGPSAYVDWTYYSPGGDPQSAYQVQVSAGGSSWNPPLSFDSGKVSGSGTSYFASGLPFDKTLKARVKVWDSNDNVSNWTESGSWKTPKHAYPYVDFTYTPSTDIPAKQPVQFTDQTTFYDSGGNRTWSWLFGDGGASTQQNQSHTYNLPGLYNTSLTATDKDGFSCSRTKQLNIAQPVPVWKEVSPR